MVRHVKTIAICLIVEGGLELLPGLSTTALGVIAAIGLVRRPPAQAEAPPPALAFVLFLLGPLLLAGGTLKIVAGIRNLQLRGRKLGLAAFVSCLAALPSCYCAPTALALGVFGFIVYLDPDVRRAFERGGLDVAAAFE
jgi:hypothetical protein